MLLQFLQSEHRRPGVMWRNVLLCCFGILLRPDLIHAREYVDMPYHWNHPHYGYTEKRIMVMGADTVMAQNAARAWRRDCAHLFLIAATAEGAIATVNEVK